MTGLKKNKKKIWKLLIQGFVYLAMLGVFAGFVVFLNRSAQTETEDVMDWEPEAAQGIPGLLLGACSGKSGV